jgi:hypothetical protein
MKQNAVLLTLLFIVAATVSSFAQTSDEIIQKYITAKGGADKLRAINDITMSGNLSTNGVQLPLSIKVLNGKGIRVEFSFNGMTGYQIITDSQGWNFNPFMGQTAPEPMTEDQVKESQDQLDATDDLLDYAAKGSTVEYQGNETIEGVETYKLKLTTKTGKVKTMYISTQDNLLLKTVQTIKFNGQEMESESLFSNYKKVNDVQMPFTTISNIQGQIDFDTIEFNTKLDLAIFKP